MNKHDIDEMISDQLAAVINRQIAACDWREGYPIEVFEDEGFPCVRYESGAWWHYDIAKGEWW